RGRCAVRQTSGVREQNLPDLKFEWDASADRLEPQVRPAASSAASRVRSGSTSDRGASSSGTAPYPAYHCATRSFFASIKSATPPTSVAARRQRLPAAS